MMLVVIIHLGVRLPAHSSCLPEPQATGHCLQILQRVPIWHCSRWGLPCQSTSPWLRCALTAPFHLDRLTSTKNGLLQTAVCFLWHFPSSHLAWLLASTFAHWSSDFPPANAGDHPAHFEELVDLNRNAHALRRVEERLIRRFGTLDC